VQAFLSHTVFLELFHHPTLLHAWAGLFMGIEEVNTQKTNCQFFKIMSYNYQFWFTLYESQSNCWQNHVVVLLARASDPSLAGPRLKHMFSHYFFYFSLYF
jgi:hypothetical protein